MAYSFFFISSFFPVDLSVVIKLNMPLIQSQIHSKKEIKGEDCLDILIHFHYHVKNLIHIFLSFLFFFGKGCKHRLRVYFH